MEKETQKINYMIKKYGKKIGRNEQCPCHSGKKYKNCCYENDLYNK